MWTILQIIFVTLGLLLVFGGDRLSLPVLFQAGMVCLGMAAIVTGWQAILTRRLLLRRRGGYRKSYTGVPAIFQGIQFNFVGLFIIGIALTMYLNNSREIWLQLVRRPGLPLVVLGGLALLQAMIMFWGSGHAVENPRGVMIMGLLLGRLFPGLIWLILGLGLSVLGLFDAIAPARFDDLGGRFLEELYGLK